MYQIAFNQVYLVTFGLLLVLLIGTLMDHEPHFLQHRLFRDMVVSTMACTALEFITWIVDGRSDRLGFFAMRIANVVLFLMNIVPLILWIIYVEAQIDQDRARLRRIAWNLGGVFAVNGIIALSSLKTGFYFFFDEANVYRRGALHWVAVCLYLGLLAYVVILPVVRRRAFPARLRLPLIFFSVPCVLGVGAQMAFYGLNLAWAGAALSLLVIYTSIQNRILSTDYLTGLYNRRQLDLFLRHSVKGLRPPEKLALFMLDIDKFKAINDTFGHPVGDMALECTAAILRKTFHHQDFIARFAGDEFAVALELTELGDLESIERRLMDKIDAFNREGAYPFKLSISFGAAVYDPTTCGSVNALVEQADRAMYEMKRLREGEAPVDVRGPFRAGA